MADVLERGSAWLEEQRHKHMARTVVYQRGTDAVEIAATVGRTKFEQVDEDGIVHRTESRDFLVGTSDLLFDGAATIPQEGDLIRETCGTETFVYEVAAPEGEPHYRYGDLYRRVYRIHTKFVGKE